MEFYTNFLLDRNQVFVRGYRDGVQFSERRPYQPTLFVPSKEPTEFKNIKGDSLTKLIQDSPNDAREFIKRYKEMSGMTVYGFPNFEYSAISDWYPGKIEYNPNLIRVIYFDIEVWVDSKVGGFPDPAEAKWPINSVSVVYNNKCIVFGLGEFDVDNMTQHYDMSIIFKGYATEEELLSAFVSFWCWVNPDVVSGWYIETFDVPYVIHRLNILFGSKYAQRLSPVGRIRQRNFTGKYGKEETTYNINGVAILDYIDLYRKHTFITRENYSLDHISQVELGESKIDYTGNLFTLYEDDPQLFFEYSAKDSILVYNLNKKLGLIELIFNVSYFAKINFEDVSSPVKTWDVIIADRLLREQNIVVHTDVKPPRGNQSYGGAYVHDPKPGLYDWLMSVDKTSMYPMIIQSENIGPDTFVPDSELTDELIDLRESVITGGVDALITQSINTDILKHYNYSMTANGEFYRRDYEGIFSRLVGELFIGRKTDKNEMLASDALIEKINQILHNRGVE